MDLSSLGSVCASSALILLVAALAKLVFGLPLNDVVLASLGAVTFSGFIVYDTRRISEGQHPNVSLGAHQYVMGAVALYMDIINLFIDLLRMFGKRED